jgi:hypothetical protein
MKLKYKFYPNRRMTDSEKFFPESSKFILYIFIIKYIIIFIIKYA